MKFWRRNWYYIGGALFVLLAFFMGLWGCYHLQHIQVILIFSWMGMLMHQFEEYAYPGGFPLIANMVGLGEINSPDRYPINAMQGWLSNVIFCYLSYIIPIFFPNLVWMGASQVFAGVWQLPGHGIAMNVRLKSFYNPGLASTAFLQTPVAIYYIWYVIRYMPEQAGQLWWGIPGSLAILILTFLVPIFLMKNKNSKYPFEESELYGYGRKKVDAIWKSRMAAKAGK